MISKSLGALIGLAAALPVAWQLGGTAGNGALVGWAAGAGTTFALLAWQARLRERAPQRMLQAFAASMLLKLCVLLACALAVRFVEPLAARVDWRAFLVAFAASAVLVLVPGTIETMRPSKASRAL
jgi:hypothetical protein